MNSVGLRTNSDLSHQEIRNSYHITRKSAYLIVPRNESRAMNGVEVFADNREKIVLLMLYTIDKCAVMKKDTQAIFSPCTVSLES